MDESIMDEDLARIRAASMDGGDRLGIARVTDVMAFLATNPVHVNGGHRMRVR